MYRSADRRELESQQLKESLGVEGLEADITGLPVTTMKQPDAGALGAAILAGVGVGVWNTIDDAVTATVRTDRVFEPQARVHEIYVHRYDHYKSTYNALVPRFAAMATS